MSAYETVPVGKLKLKGKSLDVKVNGIKKKKKDKNPNHYHHYDEDHQIDHNISELSSDPADRSDTGHDRRPSYLDHLTPAERRYLEQKEKIDRRRLAMAASKSHRDRIQEFNQYLANLSERYDIPKVGPG
ncbi:unnamed protein product [Spirodela intermedia]|uniref:Uncharacterized protein n=1 Tax=Spirodela intermedia TaxID=51605 RepID=A0A7I8JIV3_SPIIN|nr:unnamed protein product [Spirodela intermedia]CAA6670087.1 unnamed protein product [Spirodela intermedia]